MSPYGVTGPQWIESWIIITINAIYSIRSILYHSCWWPGIARSQSINSLDIDLVPLIIFGSSTTRVQLFGNEAPHTGGHDWHSTSECYPSTISYSVHSRCQEEKCQLGYKDIFSSIDFILKSKEYLHWITLGLLSLEPDGRWVNIVSSDGLVP